MGKSWLRSMGRGIKKGAEVLGNAGGSVVDVASHGITDFGSYDDKITQVSPYAGIVTDQHNSIASGIKEGATSAWDVLSGDRDYRRNRENFLENRDYTADREDTSYVRLMDQLKEAGINPMMAGQLNAPSVNSSDPPLSNNAQGARGVLGLAGSIFQSGMAGVTGMASAQAAKATSALHLAQAGATLSKLPGEISHTAAQAVAANSAAIASEASAGLSRAHSAESQARIPLHRAHVQESQARTGKVGAETENIRLQKPKFSAEADFYRRYGKAGVMADVLKNPWQSAMFSSSRAGDAIESAAPASKDIVALVGSSARSLYRNFNRLSGAYKAKRR